MRTGQRATDPGLGRAGGVAMSGSGSAGACSHPWLRVTCGACGAPVDELRQAPNEEPVDLDAPGPKVTQVEHLGGDHTRKLFIVARGHPELVEQLRAVLGDTEAVVIEDRRRSPRDADAPPLGRIELRRRVLRDPDTPQY